MWKKLHDHGPLLVVVIKRLGRAFPSQKADKILNIKKRPCPGGDEHGRFQ